MQSEANTKQRILDAAEDLFAANGFAHTSMRAITAHAGANLAAVNYHFGSKEVLIETLFERRVQPMNEERLRRLDALERRHGDDIPLAELIEAFVGPAMALSRDNLQGGARFMKLLGRSYTEPSEGLHEHLRRLYSVVVERFKPAFARALPHLPRDELYWRMHFMIGTLAYCMAGSDAMRLIASCEVCDPLDTDGLTRRLVGFLEAAFSAPVAGPGETEPASERASASQRT
jgi:AcrR family transcriptional regulator